MMARLAYVAGPLGPVLFNVVAYSYLNRCAQTWFLQQLIVTVAIAQVVGMVAAAGAPATFTKRFFDSDHTYPPRRIVVVVAVPLVVLAVVSFVLAGVVASVGAPRVVTLVVGIVFYGCAAGLGVVCQAVCRALRKPGMFVALTSLVAAGPAVAAAIAVGVGAPEGAWLLVACLGAPATVIGGVGARALRCLGPVTVRPLTVAQVREPLADVRRIGLPTLPHALSLSGLPAFLRASAGLVSPSATVIMHAAMQIGGATISFLGSVNNSWSVDIYEHPEDQRRGFVRRSLDVYLAMGASVAVGVFCVAYPFVWLTLGGGFDVTVAAATAAVLGVPAVVFPVYLGHMNYLIGLGRVQALAVVTPTCFVVGAGVGFGLYRATSALPCLAVASPVFYGILTVALAVLVRRHDGRTLLTWRAYGTIAAMALVVAALAGGRLLLPEQPAVQWVIAAAAVLPGGVAAGALVAMSRQRYPQLLLRGG